MPDDKTVRFIAEFIDGMSHEGDFTPTVLVQLERALRKARLDPGLMNEACVLLDQQDRI